jgi:hypothetical protein
VKNHGEGMFDCFHELSYVKESWIALLPWIQFMVKESYFFYLKLSC